MPADVLPETLIIGGGIGGLSAALSLARRGADVTVLERSKSFAEVGAGIQLAPNAIRILQQLDVLDAILPAAVMPRRLVLADALDGAVQFVEAVSALTEKDDDQDAPLVSHAVEDLSSRAILDHNLGRERLYVRC